MGTETIRKPSTEKSKVRREVAGRKPVRAPQPVDLLVAYLQRSWPVQWVGWWLHLREGRAKQALLAILFDAENEALRDLTRPEIRDQVVECVRTSPALRKMVLAEIAAALD